MHKAQRLIQLIMLVNERKRFTIQELADECGVSRRTMIRDLMELGELGVPLYSETGSKGGYRVLREKQLPPISFTENEAIALFFACQSLRNYNSLPFDNEVKSALHKFFYYLSSELKQKIERLQQRLVFWIPPHEMEVPFLKELLEAALDQRIITIKYETAAIRSRMIQPLGLYTMNGLWYCQSYCFLAQDYRVFRVDRVKEISLDADQSLQLDFAEERIESWIMRMDDTDTVELEVDLTPEGVRRCRSDLWLSRSIVPREDGSGTVHAKISASYTNWAAHYFIGFGVEAIVKHPLALRERMKHILKEMLDYYGQ